MRHLEGREKTSAWEGGARQQNVIVTDSERGYYHTSNTTIILSDVNYLFFSTCINDAQRIFLLKVTLEMVSSKPLTSQKTKPADVEFKWLGRGQGASP